jgi:hypothetical protein
LSKNKDGKMHGRQTSSEKIDFVFSASIR